MGIIRTDVWMEEAFSKPELFLETIKQGREDPEDFYRYLQRFGMYRPSRQAEQIFTALKKAVPGRKSGSIMQNTKSFGTGQIRTFTFFQSGMETVSTLAAAAENRA